MKKIQIGNKTIGDNCYVIAEFGVNHLGSLERAKEGIRAAASAGADAIKFQTYTADELVVKGTPKFWISEGGDVGNDQYEAYDALGGFPYEYYPELIKCCEENHIEFLSTPFSIAAADKLNDMGMKAFKIASSDMSTLPFLRHVAKYQKPILLSTGAATLEEIHEAVKAIEGEGNTQIIILHCTLCYPTKNHNLNLGNIFTLQREFPQYPIGLSDHSLEEDTSGFAVMAGAVVLEKHFTTDNSLPDSADHWLSLNPTTMKHYVLHTNRATWLRGNSEKKVFDCEKETRKYDKRSWVAKQFIPKGTTLTEEPLTWKRPGTGIWPNEDIVGKITNRDLKEDQIILWDDLKI